MADIHVDPVRGNDGNAGTIALPKKTPSGAHSAASAGDNVIYHAPAGQITGTYYIIQEQNLSNDGTAGNPITHMPYTSGSVQEVIVFTGISGSSSNPLGRLTGATIALFDLGDWIVFDGISRNRFIFERNAVGRGIAVGDDSVIKNLTVRLNGERSIGGGQHRVTVQNCEVYQGGLAHVSGSPGGWPGAISPFTIGTGVLAAGWVVTGCYIHDHWGEGIILLRCTGMVAIGNIIHDCYSVGIYTDKATAGIVDSNYIFYTNPGYNKSGDKMRLTNNASESNSPRTANTQIRYRNNILVGGSTAIRRFQDGANTQNTNYYSDWQIDNNLMYGQDTYAIDMDNVAAPSPEPTGCFIRNNIIFKGADGNALNISSSDRSAWIWQNNIFANFNPTGSVLNWATGTNSIYNTNPNLVNPVLSGSANGFALPFSSVANRAGIAIAGLTLDFFGKTRNNPPTIGPYEIPAAPTGTAETYTAIRGQVLTVAASPSGVLVNDYLGLSGTLMGYRAQTTQTGTVYVSGSGALEYTPPSGFFGTDTFLYSIQNPGGTGVITDTVIVSNSAPIAVDDNYQTTQNTTYQTGAAGGLFANDTLNSGTLLGYDTVSTRGGTIYVSGSGAFLYTPAAGVYGGVPDTFRYTIGNAIGTGTATVYFVILPNSPVPQNDSFTTIKTQVFNSGGLFTNDTLNSGTLLGYDAVTTRGGTAYVSGNGYFQYTPPAGVYGGAADTFRYSLQNSAGTGLATVSINLINVPPVLTDDTYDANQDTVLHVTADIGLFANDVLNSGTLHGWTTGTTRGGNVYVSGSGAFRYTPPAGVFSPPVDTFLYTVTNNVGSGTAMVSISIASAAVASTPSGTVEGIGRYRRYWRYWRLHRL